MSVPAAGSMTRSALCPKVEYSSVPGLQVSRLIRRVQESDWEKVKREKCKVKSVRKLSLINRFIGLPITILLFTFHC